jgi:allantoinase
MRAIRALDVVSVMSDMSDTTASAYPRDLKGYGLNCPHANWPGRAKIALQFVLNYEEGGENCVLHGDAESETFLSELGTATAYAARHLSVESMYEYGSRVGVWRILREFERRNLPLTVFAVGTALQRYPELIAAFMQYGYEIANHGWRWISYQSVGATIEREHIALSSKLLKESTGGVWPLGWYTGRDSPNTRRLVVEHGGYLYDSDYYGDDLPLWVEVDKGDNVRMPHLVVPYSLDCNDMRFAQGHGFKTGEDFFIYLRDSFDALYAEGEQAPKMMSIGMHCRLLGKPGRIGALQRFLDHVQAHERVWICRRIDIARHWQTTHPLAARQA